jgi:glucose uptake protein GlcU
MWGIAEISWFIANQELGFSVAFPLITSGPGFIGALWGIFVFKEITGQRNLIVLCAAFLVTLPALIMISLSH